MKRKTTECTENTERLKRAVTNLKFRLLEHAELSNRFFPNVNLNDYKKRTFLKRLALPVQVSIFFVEC